MSELTHGIFDIRPEGGGYEPPQCIDVGPQHNCALDPCTFPDPVASLQARLAQCEGERDQQGKYACDMLTECRRAQMDEQKAIAERDAALERVREVVEIIGDSNGVCVGYKGHPHTCHNAELCNWRIAALLALRSGMR